MKSLNLCSALLATLVAGTLVGCSSPSAKSPDVADSIRKSLDQANLNDVSVRQDRDKGVITLGGHVANEADKAQAEAAAKSYAGGQVVADEIAVTPTGAESDARAVDKNLDEAIDKNLNAALIGAKMDKGIRRDVKNGVVTLKGDVNSQAMRDRIEKLAAGVPNVRQVVNELELKEQKATSRQ